MLTHMNIVILPLCKNILDQKMLLQKNKMFHRLLRMSHSTNVQTVQQFKEGSIKENKSLEVANTEEMLPSLVETDKVASLEPIKLIPSSVRHCVDTRLLYSSLFPKQYRKPISFKYDLRDKHVLLIKDKMKKEAVDALVEKEYKKNTNSAALVPNFEQVNESFPYEKHEAVITCEKNASLKYIENHKINYKALPEVDRKKELSALLEEYDANKGETSIELAKIFRKRSIELSKPYRKRGSMKQPLHLNEFPEMEENQSNKSDHALACKSGDNLEKEKVDTCVVASDEQDKSKPATISQVPSTNIKLDEVKVCSKCKVLLDVPTTSNTPVNFYTEEKSPGSSDEQQSQLCQRCNFDAVHSDTAHVIVPPDSYLDVLRPMSTRYSLVLLVVDVMEAPCSIHPSIMDVIGQGQPVIVVANKVDLLPMDNNKALRSMWHTLNQVIKSSRLSTANIVDTVLVSARTGFGMTELRTLLHGQWRDNGDVFLVGGAGSGKTSLFKALVESISAHENLSLARRAKTYTWPLTNLGLLKFELKRVHGELRSLERGDLVERTIRPFKRLQRPVAVRPTIPARPDHSEPSLFEPHQAPLMLQDPAGEVATSGVSPSEPVSAGPACTSGVTEQQQEEGQKRVGSWLYDTPSAVMPMQVLDLLTEEEIELIRPRSRITAQTFRVQIGMSLFLAGVARIDVLYLHHPMPRDIGWSPHENAKLTVYAAKSVPRTLVRTVNASSVYRDHMGDEVLMVPRGSAERMSQWPVLKPENFTTTGPNDGVAAADIVLPSVGFVSVWLHPLTVCSLRVWTPGGRGAFLRSPSLLPHAIRLRGDRQKGGIVYDDHVPFEEKKSDLDPSKPPSPERLDDRDPRSPYVKIRHRLGYQNKYSLF